MASETADKPMHARFLTRRCGAKTRSGKPCQSPAVSGKARCRMHGGAHGIGAPRGERNGQYRHGRFTHEAIEERRLVRTLIRACRDTLGLIDE